MIAKNNRARITIDRLFVISNTVISQNASEMRNSTRGLAKHSYALLKNHWKTYCKIGAFYSH